MLLSDYVLFEPILVRYARIGVWQFIMDQTSAIENIMKRMENANYILN